jgi:hypothetical protein
MQIFLYVLKKKLVCLWSIERYQIFGKNLSPKSVWFGYERKESTLIVLVASTHIFYNTYREIDLFCKRRIKKYYVPDCVKGERKK